jgi:hypothetical protein
MGVGTWLLPNIFRSRETAAVIVSSHDCMTHKHGIAVTAPRFVTHSSCHGLKPMATCLRLFEADFHQPTCSAQLSSVSLALAEHYTAAFRNGCFRCQWTGRRDEPYYGLDSWKGKSIAMFSTAVQAHFILR